ncbi:MAG: cobalamin biosynthesis protein [Selenomonadaceae bacterium]|nr:cobalamin biosynthesis protein [Selenomonadaceae bacterium]
MRCAVIALSKNGVELAGRIKKFFDCDVYVKSNYEDNVSFKALFYDKLSLLTAEIFAGYDAIIFVCAAGIAVRMIAPHIKNKLEDPAVIVIDETGKYAVSLLSGHIGGANLLSKRLAEIISAEAVITTATDSHEIAAPDLVASVLALTPYPKSEILNFNSLLLKNGKISYFIDSNLTHKDFYKRKLKDFNIEAKVVDELNPQNNEHSVFITDNPREKKNALYLSPQKLVAGVGCRKGVAKETILNAISDATKKIGRDISFIDLIASVEAKKDEAGILGAAASLNIDAEFFSNEILREKIEQYKLKESAFVKEHIGVGNASEAAALAAVKKGKFALEKTVYEKVTVALVWEKLPL